MFLVIAPRHPMESRPVDINPPPLPTSSGQPDSPDHIALLGALGRLARGLSLIFWGLPIALVICSSAFNPPKATGSAPWA
jgi:hypothetical protein